MSLCDPPQAENPEAGFFIYIVRPAGAYTDSSMSPGPHPEAISAVSESPKQ